MKKRRIVKDFLLAAIKKNEKVYFIQRELRLASNKQHRNDVLTMDDVHKLTLQQFGEKNQGITILFLDDIESGKPVGFFALFLWMIHACKLAERCGFIPYFYWGKNNLYSEKGENGFTYYFKQGLDLPISDVRDSASVVIPTLNHLRHAKNLMMKRNYDVNDPRIGYAYNQRYYEECARLAGKYVQIKEKIRERIKRDLKELLQNKKVLGVHIRIEIFQKEIAAHPKSASLDEYIALLKEKEKEYDGIFVATVERKTIERLIKLFGKERILFYPQVYRNEMGIVEYADTKPHAKGFEVLRDAYTLAACDGYIGGVSNVSSGAQIIRLMEKGEDFTYKYIFDRGIFMDGISPVESAKKYAPKDYKRFKGGGHRR